MIRKTIEVFSAGCPLCAQTTEQVRRLAVAHDFRLRDVRTDEGRARAAQIGVARVPAVAVDGMLIDCCRSGAVRLELVQARLT